MVHQHFMLDIEFIHARILSLRRQGCAILLVSADLDEILALSDRVMVMNAGRVTSLAVGVAFQST